MKMLTMLVAILAVSFVPAAQVHLTKRLSPRHAAAASRSQSHVRYKRDSTTNGTRPQPEQMFEYFVTVGTPPQNVIMSFDTTAADVYVNTCPCADCCRLDSIDPRLSSTYRNDSSHFNNGHEDKGYSGTDVVGLLDYTINAQAFGVISDIGSPDSESRGRIGLGWPSLSENNMQPVMQNLKPQLDQQIFAFYMHNAPTYSESHFAIGEMPVGFCQEQFNYVQLSSTTYWQFQMNGFTMGSYSYTNKAQGMIASMETVIAAAEPHFSAIVKATGASADGTLPCTGNYPDMKFIIGGVQYTIPSTNYIFKSDDTCYLLVSPLGGLGFSADFVFGEPLLASYCTVYDYSRQRIGFAEKKIVGPSIPQ